MSGPLGVDRRRVAAVDARSPGGWEVPAPLPEPAANRPRVLADVVAGAGEQRLEAGGL